MNFESLLFSMAAEDYLRAAMDRYIASGRMDAKKRPEAEALIAAQVERIDEKPSDWFNDFAGIEYCKIGESVMAKLNAEIRAAR